MHANLPPIADIREELEALGHAEVQALARISAVPFTTLWKIRAGITSNPGIETVRLFYPHIKAATAPVTTTQPATDSIANKTQPTILDLEVSDQERREAERREEERREAERRTGQGG